MPKQRTAPFGAWQSPITADLVASGGIRLAQPRLEGTDIYWIERRPLEAGRNAIVRRTPDGRVADLFPTPFDARTRVHEYGGGDYAVHEGVVYFANFAGQRVYRIAPEGTPAPITPEGAMRYADFRVDAPRRRLLCVREEHVESGPVVNTLASLDIEGDNADGGRVLVSGNDFYASPRLSPDGTHLAWLTWNHPDMPWDATELWVAQVREDGTLWQARRVAGGAGESIFQPEWSPEGELHFASDRTGWWNLYRLRSGGAQALHPMEAEFGRPQWQFGSSTYAFAAPHRIYCAYTQHGRWRLASLDTETGELTPIETAYTEIGDVRAADGYVVFVGGSPDAPTALVQLEAATSRMEVLHRAGELELDRAYLSMPESLEYPTSDGQTAHALFYRPRNPVYQAPPTERPPLLVLSHGGPTSTAVTELQLPIQFWTSRGFAVLDVNYGGSTGYGRPYRQRLEGQWGVVDVDDCVNGARYLAARGEVDPERLAIRGGSAGGYTTLCALTFHDAFKAGASYFGVSDVEALARDTHKFEARYLDRLIGPYPERRDIYHARSAIHFTEQLSSPVIFFQGLDDRVVPPGQAEEMVAALRKKKLPVAYLAFAGEGHGFRKAENTRRSLEAELYFYGRVFGFIPADEIEPVQIENMA
jgi:dipeptidyl aminopeptidase/acylaminoacyl peptidase